ncbi:pyridoxal-phosphate dependent enzyme [Tichowtungia aerotolerans]|uniref:threonine ammonia-lyase n=1 Tax=Tichowtungia aerotolerans TaxID=2697043 RepID=A0A6P1MI41_9BACT|nr:pyridoxal-phosphate dependent enzyme [Tichowtungia aerotolerans]QHI70715.1 pyridoxal-phosphate dependent enzyme [Tichowtungia aerotolerans]
MKTVDQLFEEILRARTRVYRAGAPTPLQPMRLPEAGACEVFIKREDLGPINAYKWRGAYNAVAAYHQQTGCETVVAASAGNHAQGVARAARLLGIQAKIFMPLAAPLLKQEAVRQHGGDHVEIILTGDTYNEADQAARSFAEEHDLTYIHPFDDLYTMAGQATIADEIMLSGTVPDVVFLQIGGGGMAGAVSCWLKKHWPDIRIIGVEAAEQASMKASIEAGYPVTLDSVDTFCDGTAVTRPGDLTYSVCRETIDEFITVTNDEVSAAIQRMWESLRVIPETSGAIGLAGLIQYTADHRADIKDKKLLCICSGANMDFSKLAQISRAAAIGTHHRRYIRFHLNEESGSMLSLLDRYFIDIAVGEFLYGKVDKTNAWPIIAVEGETERLNRFEQELSDGGIQFENVTHAADVRYRIINYNPALFKNPLLLHIEFPERKGALRDFMRRVSGLANVCYFNYAYSGEAIGHTLMGFEFETPAARDNFLTAVGETRVSIRPVDQTTAERILQHTS